jgi:hypothetical protein
MSQKNQIYILAASTLLLAGTTAYFAYVNYSVKESLAGWYKTQPETTRNTLPVDIQNMLNKTLS